MDVSLLKCYTLAYIVLTVFLNCSGQTLVPKGCSKSGSSAYCYPHIPSFLDINRWDLTGVSTFRLYSSSSLVWTLPTLPNDVFEMSRDITYLSMNDIGLENLPCDIFNPFRKSLETIYLDGNLFREFPICSLKGFAALKYIHLENQHLKAFHADTNNWEALKEIYLRNNEISIVNISNIHNQNEVSLYLDNNKISVFQIFDMNHISYLSARNNLIRHVYRHIFQHSKTTLKYLDSSQNYLDSSIWGALVGISSIQTLKLNNNKMSVVSSIVLNSAGNLEYLDLSNNQLTSLAEVTLRSGKLRYLLLGSNKLREIQSYLTSSTKTFGSYPQQYNLSDNAISEIHISIPTDAKYLSVRLDRNILKSVTFEDLIEISTLNISNNEMTYLPHPLPKASRYVLSNNPLNSTEVIIKLTREMVNASYIDLENVKLFCGDVIPHLPFLNSSRLVSLNLKHNCVPLDIICSINTSCSYLMSLYLDNNTAAQLSCSIQDKCFNVLSLDGCGLHNRIIEHIVRDSNPKLLRKVSMKNNDVTTVPLLNYTSIGYYETNYDFSLNKIKRFEGFAFHGKPYLTTLNFASNEISSVTPGTFYPYGHSNLYLLFGNNSLVNINNGLVKLYQYNSIFSMSVTIDVSYNYIEKLHLRNIIVLYYNYILHGSIYINMNMSHNQIQVLEGCMEIDNALSFAVTLDLSYNYMTSLPNTSCRMTYQMYLGYNKISGIMTPLPQAVTQLLDLQWNAISEVHDNAFDNLTQLVELNLRGNRIQSFPASITTLANLNTLDISFNRIRFISERDITNIKRLTKLIITDNDFFTPSYDLQLNKHYLLEDNKVHCNCQMLFLRNQSISPHLQLSGRCSSPSEYEGYHVTCFPVTQCIGFVPIYLTKDIIEACQNDQFYEIKMNTTVVEKKVVIYIKLIGPRIPEHIDIKAYKVGTFLKDVKLEISDRSNVFVLDRKLEPDRLCFTSVFNNNDTILRCVPFTLQSRYSSNKTGANDGTLYGIGSLLGISLIVNILIGLFTFYKYRQKHMKSVKRTSSKAFSKEHFEIPTVTESANTKNVSQPVYEEISEAGRNDQEQTYTNLALDV